jgi:hypothetical protein
MARRPATSDPARVPLSRRLAVWLCCAAPILGVFDPVLVGRCLADQVSTSRDCPDEWPGEDDQDDPANWDDGNASPPPAVVSLPRHPGASPLLNPGTADLQPPTPPRPRAPLPALLVPVYGGVGLPLRC